MQCSTAGWGCIDCKKVLAESMEQELVPIRAPGGGACVPTPRLVEDVLSAGADRCRDLAHETMDVVRDRMGF